MRREKGDVSIFPEASGRKNGGLKRRALCERKHFG